MKPSKVCTTEDAIQTFLDQLVDPLLPAKYSMQTKPTLDQQHAVAKQVHAVVLLYNYYLRKSHTHLKYLEFEEFCKWAIVLKPTLNSYMKLMLRSDDSKSDDLEKQLSITEKAIKDACDLSKSLDAMVDSPSTKGLTVSKIAVLLVDLKKENCALLFGEITKGVWSVIEKELQVSAHTSNGSIDAKHMNKRKRTRSACEAANDEYAFSAVKEATNGGISQDDLSIIGSHVVYSLSKEKTTTCFYIMQCIHEEKGKDNIKWRPIDYVLERLQGPLVDKPPFGWACTSVVEYFHLLPYIGIISQWFLSGSFPDSLQDQKLADEIVNLNDCGITEKTCELENSKNATLNMTDPYVENHSNGTTNVPLKMTNPCVENHSNGTTMVPVKMTNPCVENHSSGTTIVPLKMMNPFVENDSSDTTIDPLKMTNPCVENHFSGTTIFPKFEESDPMCQTLNHKSQKISIKNAALEFKPTCQDWMPASNHALVSHEFEYSAKIQSIISSKEPILSDTALRVLLGKRDKLVLQQRSIGDAIAECDKKIKTILNGGENDLELKIDLITEACNDLCQKSATEGRSSSIESLSEQDPCQELDDVCKEKQWMLPMYNVLASDGGYEAKVMLKTVEFEFSIVGDVCPKPAQARKSAALKMLAKLFPTRHVEDVD